jgi:hypothetical protein
MNNWTTQQRLYAAITANPIKNCAKGEIIRMMISLVV